MKTKKNRQMYIVLALLAMLAVAVLLGVEILVGLSVFFLLLAFFRISILTEKNQFLSVFEIMGFNAKVSKVLAVLFTGILIGIICNAFIPFFDLKSGFLIGTASIYGIIEAILIFNYKAIKD